MISMTTTTDRSLPSFSTDDARWEAVQHRDPATDGVFYCSVRSTGVYCRPSCTSRLPRRENVGFHATAADAEAAGFRPCKRCRPNEAPLAMTSIRFAVGECPLGAILVAATDKGVSAILLGDDPDALARDLQDRFPKTRLIDADDELERLLAKVVNFIEAPFQGLDLPLDMRGTAFQQRVWRALREIPSGSTASYTEIANRIGAPRAVRAIAQACGANALAVAIPCHRVVASDGTLSGYRWGVERKRALLEREAAA
jgi:AraC family transcriptional regulator of adaptative response/methylated-DNA-[protein]-cysteine methyltransferase